MVASTDQNLVYDLKISSVGPSRVTGTDIFHEPIGVDIAMKLHYLHGVYFFSSQASRGLDIMRIKESLFFWCCDYYTACGRFRRSDDTGRPFIKCNDCGVRIIEAECDKTIDEWLKMKDCSSLNNKFLIYHLPIGPEISFSPLCYLQMTKFKCGGMSLGLSWAHILGDPFSASECINTWGLFLSSLKSNGPIKIIKSPKRLKSSEDPKEPLSLKRVDPLGDLWVTTNNCKMETFSIYLTATKVSQLLSNIWGQSPNKEIPLFESLCAIMWQSIAKVRESHEPKIVTICKKDPNHPKRGLLSNSQIISSVKADFPIKDSNLRELANLLARRDSDENDLIEELVEKDNGMVDYILYGANLTFLNLEEANLYGLEWNGHKPIFVHYSIQGVGDEGAVLVLPWPENCGKYDGEGRVITVILPENEAMKLKSELKENGLLPENEFE
ncbi:protein ECERIFERUM 26-like [Mercurialis annua]|uniref:protein ECERIFERUM 26-like n=1 Tax=Mercurialis annua TaxID=3986 RepID=UPI00215F3BC6|nr:protein ECERIFERUM 26-like [Mercurialis annua]